MCREIISHLLHSGLEDLRARRTVGEAELLRRRLILGVESLGEAGMALLHGWW